MATSVPSPAPPPGQLSESDIEFPDNRILIDLCGELDRNLVQIEQRLGVQIQRRGNLLALHGAEDERTNAETVLRALYARLEQGREVTPGDIDAAVRMGPGEAPRKSAAAEPQLDMFGGAPLEIRTRRKLVEPRTAAQKGYVVSLFRNELVETRKMMILK